jgi:hypothetical protein
MPIIMFDKEIGTSREVFHGRAQRTSDGHVQKDFCLSESGRVALAVKQPKKPLPEKLVRYNEAKSEVLKQQGIKKGDPFDKFIVKKGSSEHEKIMALMKKSGGTK